MHAITLLLPVLFIFQAVFCPESVDSGSLADSESSSREGRHCLANSQHGDSFGSTPCGHLQYSFGTNHFGLTDSFQSFDHEFWRRSISSIFNPNCLAILSWLRGKELDAAVLGVDIPLNLIEDFLEQRRTISKEALAAQEDGLDYKNYLLFDVRLMAMNLFLEFSKVIRSQEIKFMSLYASKYKIFGSAFSESFDFESIERVSADYLDGLSANLSKDLTIIAVGFALLIKTIGYEVCVGRGNICYEISEAMNFYKELLLPCFGVVDLFFKQYFSCDCGEDGIVCCEIKERCREAASIFGALLKEIKAPLSQA